MNMARFCCTLFCRGFILDVIVSEVTILKIKHMGKINHATTADIKARTVCIILKMQCIKYILSFSGASSGIGWACAVELSRWGAKLALTGRNEERLQETAELCRKEGLPDNKVGDKYSMYYKETSTC